MELNMELTQSQVLSAQQIQSMEILQMSHQELRDHINEALVENPVLDAEERPAAAEASELVKKLKWLEAEDQQNRHYIRSDREAQTDPLQRVPVTGTDSDTLYRHIERQLDALNLPDGLYRCGKYAAACLDDSGYLPETAAELAQGLGVPEPEMARAVEVLRGLEPAGVGGRDLRDCLLLQLKRERGEPAGLAARIVSDYLEKLGRSQYSHMAKALGCSEGEVRAASSFIRTLRPRPGADFDTPGQVAYIWPDVVVVKFQDHFQILTGDYDMPSLHINAYYAGLLRESDDREVAAYLGERIKKAKWLIGAIAQRRSTLLRCAQAILEKQEPFFRGEAQGLAPMTMADLAEGIGVHESTVSRAVKGKYLQCTRGVYPLGYFFSRRLGGAPVSADTARRLLRDIVEGEDKARPLSDMKIAALMEGQGVPVSRRTVAKYRAELHIPSTVGRKIIS